MQEVLNCDNPDCGHVEHVGEIREAHVDMPCPVCGENLLTREDWIGWKPYQAVMKASEELARKAGGQGGGAPTEMRVGLHDGRTTITIDRLKTVH